MSVTTIDIPIHLQDDYCRLEDARAPLRKAVDSKRIPGLRILTAAYFVTLFSIVALLLFLMSAFDNERLRAFFGVVGVFGNGAVILFGLTLWSDRVLPWWQKRHQDRWATPDHLYSLEQKMWSQTVSELLEESGEGKLAYHLNMVRWISCDMMQEQEMLRWSEKLTALEQQRCNGEETHHNSRAEQSIDNWRALRESRDEHERRMNSINQRRSPDHCPEDEFDRQLFVVRPDGSYQRAEIVRSENSVVIEVAEESLVSC